MTPTVTVWTEDQLLAALTLPIVWYAPARRMGDNDE
jgi:hypothetical protein